MICQQQPGRKHDPEQTRLPAGAGRCRSGGAGPGPGPCSPGEKLGARISDLRLAGKAIEADKVYQVAGWAPVAEARSAPGVKPVWALVETWLKAQGARVKPRRLNTPRLLGVGSNPGGLG